MIDRKSIAVIVPTAPSGMLFPQLAFYVRDRFEQVIIAAPEEDGSYDQVPVMRNKMIEGYLHNNAEWFAFLDNDLLPTEKLDPLWEAPGNIVGAEYTLRSPTAWSNQNTVHGGAIRIHRKVFETLPQPWFKYIYNEKHTALVGCECLYFCRNALNAGFTVNRAGWTDHKNLRSYC